ncbi:MAG: hypothetical protein AMJ54_04655 [Deltaproteobacteria bacterium SG8_13]|nr:MAG: hypothetical protein AMJ54_04655 [Deltaproteobacteria bacterium SG8_13]
MNTKPIISVVIGALLLVGIAAAPATAGSRERGRFEGFALGFGAAVLGHALIHQHHPAERYQAPVDRRPPAPERYHHRRDGHRKTPAYRNQPKHRYHHRRGHWELKRIWVPPAVKKDWKPGHRNRRGRWIPGRWIEVPVSEGHWKKERVWVVGK